MKKKTILFLLVLVLLIIPNFTNAMTEEEAMIEAQKILDQVPIINNEDGTCTWDVKMINLETIQENTCNYTKETILEAYPFWANLSDEELNTTLEEHNASCKKTIVSLLFENVFEKMKNENGGVFVGSEGYKNNSITVTSYYNYIDGENHLSVDINKTCAINFVTIDDEDLKNALKVTNNIDYQYSIEGLNSFNSVYHYGPLFDNAFDDEIMLYRFPEFKKVIMNNPEYEYKIAWEGAGGTPIMNGSAGYVTLYKNGIAYAMKYVGFELYNEFYVDKDASGTPAEKAEKRLKEYFGKNIKVEVDKENVQYFNEDEFKGYLTSVTIGNHKSDIFIEEVDKKDLDKYHAHAHHKHTGVAVDSDSYEVPLDATLDVEDVKDKDHVKKAFSNGMFTLTDAYDINVIKTANGATVEVVENGIEVYIPVEKRKVGQKVNVHHITEDGKLGEKYQAVVVEKEGKLYAKFTTTHFSTYAISDLTTIDVKNPETADNISNSLFICGMSIIILLLVSIIFMKKNKISINKTRRLKK